MPSPLRYDTITQTHPEYDGARFEQIEDLYEGGWRIMRKAEKYLPKLALEHKEHYETRCKTAAYMPYFGQIVDQFGADLFAQPLSIQPASDADNPNTPGDVPDKEFYPELATNIDNTGTTLEEMAGTLLTCALKHRRAYLMIDSPDVSAVEPPANLAEEDEVGARRCYAYEVEGNQVIDWKWDSKAKRFEWVIIATKEQERLTPEGKRDTIRETYTIWKMDLGVAIWTRYAISYDPDKPPKAETLVQVEAEGSTSFDRIPLLRFELPKGLWVGNKIGPQALEHWRRRSSLVGAEGRSCVAVPVISLGPELPAKGRATSEVAENPNRGRDPVGQFEKQGFVVLGHEDKAEFIEPLGHAYEIIDKQIEGVRESMFSVNHQMAASIRPSATALGRSGLSKQKDEDKTTKVLSALGRFVREFWRSVYDVIANVRKEAVVWVPHGLDGYETDDREQVLEEAISLQAVAVPSQTFRKEHAKRMVKKLLPGLPPETVATISDEIDKGIEGEQEIRELTQDVQKDMLENPPEPGTPGAPGAPPMPKAPTVKSPTTKGPKVKSPKPKAA